MMRSLKINPDNYDLNAKNALKSNMKKERERIQSK